MLMTETEFQHENQALIEFVIVDDNGCQNFELVAQNRKSMRLMQKDILVNK